MPLRIVSYSMRREAYLPDVLTRCINARTSDFCRRVWGNDRGQSAILFDGDTKWTKHAKAVEAELAEADVIFAYDGRVAAHHKKLLSKKPVITLAENWLNVDRTYIADGLPGAVIGHHQAIMPAFRSWSVFPLPVPFWEDRYQPVSKPKKLTICYAPLQRRGSYPSNHRLHWFSKGYRTTMRILENFAASSSIPVKITTTTPGRGNDFLEVMRKSHIVIDECITGSYHRESLEGLASGAVVINGLGLRPEIQEVFLRCADGECLIPFHHASQESLCSVLTILAQKGPHLLAEEGSDSRRWMEEHWNFQAQWHRFWNPVVEKALANRTSKQITKPKSRAVAVAAKTERRLSVIVVSHNEGAYLRRTVSGLLKTLPADGEVVIVDDCSNDGSADGLSANYNRVTVLHPPARLGIAAARNFGAAQAKGEILVFSDAHVEVPERWLAPLLKVLERPEVGAVAPAINNLKRRTGKGKCGGTWRWAEGAAFSWKWLGHESPDPYPVPLLCGCFIAMRRDVFDATGGFDSGMILYGVEDSELSLRLWTLGYECLVVPEVVVSHRFGSPDSNAPSSYKFQRSNFIHNELRLAIVHFGMERIQRLLERLTCSPEFSEAFALTAESNAWQRRDEVQSVRRYDDNWFFSKFNL